ncbi:alpha/beta fold hydrolase [Halalkalibacillus halophilus]|uniref:alpha/beta fold hydrolase n=1 Tax=Halalkalibacillus halophilus TaxID=392827 RepID=UPI0012EBEC9F|nr:alpha/beta hydrolase [Halalkalibacillus halophilus]
MVQEIINRNNVNVVGQGDKTIVLAHGFGADQTMWRYILPDLEQDYRIVLFDYVGSGYSTSEAFDEEKYQNLHGYAQDLIDVCEATGVESAVFIGHSVSSMIGMLASLQKPELFERMVMIGPSPRYINDSDGYYGGFEMKDVHELLEMMEMNFVGWASHMAPIAMKNEDRPSFTKNLEKTFTENDPFMLRKFLEATLLSDHRAQLSQLEVKTLILQCSDDSFVPIEIANYLEEQIPDSKLVVMRAKGHYPHLTHPEETVTEIRTFIE